MDEVFIFSNEDKTDLFLPVINMNNISKEKLDEIKNIKAIYLEDGNKEYYDKVRKIFNQFKERGITNFVIYNNNINGKVTGAVGKCSLDEFFEGEKIIDEFISNIDPNWSDLEKAFYIHSNMGKLVGYCYNFKEHSKDINDKKAQDVRNIWRSLVTKESVCNGISSIMHTLLNRVNIKSEYLSSGGHSFLNINLNEGNVLSDPTWDLSSSTFDFRINMFGTSYEELREFDIRRKVDGSILFDSGSHILKDIPENIAPISDEERRKLGRVIGTVREDNKYKARVYDFTDECNSKNYSSNEEKVNDFFNKVSSEYGKLLCNKSELSKVIAGSVMGLEDISKDGKIFKNISSDVKTYIVYKKEDETMDKPKLLAKLTYDDIEHFIYLDEENLKFENIPTNEVLNNFYQSENDYNKIKLESMTV